MLKQQILSTIEKNKLIDYGDGIVVGISGGYDSVCLLHILHSISNELKLNIFPVHINHMLRGEEALRDENFVKDFCDSLGIGLHIERVDITKIAQKEKISLEEAGRNARYEEFSRVAKRSGATKIAVAHSRNDQVETVLMRIFRGTGIDGLKGIEYKRDNIIRPLLDTDRSQIEAYVNSKGLKAIIDSSNLHTDFFRNRIRLNVIPTINSAVGADISDSIIRLSKIVVADEDYLRYNAKIYYERSLISKARFNVELSLSELKNIHQAVLSRVLRMAMFDACGDINGFEYIHIEKLIWLIEYGKTGARVDIFHGMMAKKSYETLVIQKKITIEIAPLFEKRLYLNDKTYIDEINATLTIQKFDFETNAACIDFINKNKDKYTKFIDIDSLGLEKLNEICVRNRKEGDIFKPLKSKGTKKLKKYFIDNKVPREDRDKIPLIATNKEIIWIIGNKTSDNYKVTDNTKAVLMINVTYSE